MTADAMAILESLGLPCRQKQGEIRLTRSICGRQIPVSIHIKKDRLTLYARLKKDEDPLRAALVCNRRNRTLGDGCLVASEDGTVYLKQTVYLMDALYAQECVTRALQRQKELVRLLYGI